MTIPVISARERFVQMLQACEGGLLGHARRLTRGDDERAQDLVQDALVRAYEALLAGRFQDGFAPCAWLSRILTNHFINDWRRRSKWEAGITVEALTCGGEAGPAATRAPSVEEEFVASALDEPLERALGALPESLRLAVLLVDVEEYSYAEAAHLLDVPVGTIRSRLFRARYFLAERLAGVAAERGWTK